MTQERDEFEGATVAIVGGRLGTGPAVVNAFLKRGARVIVGDLPAPATTIPAFEGARHLPVDLADTASVNRFLDQCEEGGPLRVLVMVAPPVKSANVFDIAESEFRNVVNSELLGPLLGLREAARRMTKHGFGRLISFSSMSGKTGVHPRVSPYAAAKGGLITFSRSLASEIAPSGVTVNVIATALFDVQVAADADHTDIAKAIPVGRVGKSAEAAHAVLFLASENAGYITGETLNLSGGRFMD